MNGLPTYRDSRLELGDMIRAALHLARGAGDEEAEKRARELLARLAADRFQLAVVGQFSRGKTTLMNALLGGAYLPMGALPMTSVITTVRYGSQPPAMVRRRARDRAGDGPGARGRPSPQCRRHADLGAKTGSAAQRAADRRGIRRVRPARAQPALRLTYPFN